MDFRVPAVPRENRLKAGLQTERVAAQALSQTGSETIKIPLAYQEVSYTVMYQGLNQGVAISEQPGPFAKEPALGKTKIRRGRLNTPGSGDAPLPFLWDCGAGKLFLDLNRNGNLTDDSTGVFTAAVRSTGSSPYLHASFTNVYLTFGTGPGRRPWLVDLNLSEYRGVLNAYASRRSFWSGKASLAGRDWQVGVVDDQASLPDSAVRGYVLLRPWERRQEPFSVSEGSLDTFQAVRELFIQSRLYGVKLGYVDQGDQSHCELTLTERTVDLGEVKLAGELIQRAVLKGESRLAVLAPSAGAIRVPIGSYHDCQVEVGKDGTFAHAVRLNRNPAKPVQVSKDKSVTVALGGPLTNRVTVTPRGRILVFDYRLVGAGGETYQFGAADRTHPPEFVVSQGEKPIASGKFQFG